ncbi:hypothetical protein Agub_g4545, partial [Astrephomene gubernaculifera]
FLQNIVPGLLSQQDQHAQEAALPENANHPTVGNETFRSITISACLARQCAVVQGLQDMLEEEQELEEQHPNQPAKDLNDTQPSKPDPATASSTFNPSSSAATPAAALSTSSTTATVTLPCVPASIPGRGIQLLDRWAQQQQQALDSGRTLQDWLPGFLAANLADVLGPAACAADFLGCQTFQDLVLQLQLLRWALQDPSPSPSSFAAPFRSLLQWWRSAGGRSRSGGSGGGGGSGGDGTAATASAGLGDGEPVLTEAQLRLLPCLQPQQPQERPTGQSSSPDAAPAAAAAASAAAMPPQPAQQHASGPSAADTLLPRRLIVPDEFESLVSELYDSGLVTYTSAQVADVRRYLYALGFIPGWSCAVQGERQQRQGKSVYASLEVRPLPPGYEVAAVEVEAESHDQGWSSYPEDRNTRNNSWTWVELQLYDTHGDLVPAGVHRRAHDGGSGDGGDGGSGDGGGGGERPRLFTNLHAISAWQTHAVKLGPESDLVRDLNAVLAGRVAAVAAAAAAAPEAASTAAEQAVASGSAGAEVGAERWGEVSEEGANRDGNGNGNGDGGGRCSLGLLMCAAFPGWVCYMRRGGITVEARPVYISAGVGSRALR